MSSIVVKFPAWMRKQATSTQGETTLGFEVSSRKRPKRFSLDKEAQKRPVVIIVGSLERASSALLALDGAS